MNGVSWRRRQALREAHGSKDVLRVDALLKAWQYPQTYAEYVDYAAKHRDLDAGFQAAVAELRAAHQAGDVLGLRAKLDDWTYPKTYDEYGEYVAKHGELEARAGIPAALAELQAAVDSQDVRTLKEKLDAWSYSTDSAEYSEYVAKHEELAGGFETALQDAKMARTTASPPQMKGMDKLLLHYLNPRDG